jgi:hypothetical protein
MSGEERILDRFEGVRRRRDGEWMVLCPAHRDRNPSLHVTHREGRWLLFCHAGCALEDVLCAAELEQRELFDGPGNGHSEVDAVYRYDDERGEELFQVVRFAGKVFRQRTLEGWGLNGTRRVLFQLPRVLAAVARGERVWIAEGEKDVLALQRLGIAATTNPMGAGKWRSEYGEHLRGARVTIVADRDEPGRAHARQVAKALEGVAAEVAVLEPPRAKDVSDHVTQGGALEELVELGIHSATRESTVAESVSPLPFTRMRDVIANAPSEPAWVWHGYVAPAAVSLIAGRPKVGKSTLVFGFIAAVLEGHRFAGRATRKNGVLLLTEESADTLAEKARRFGVADHPRFHVLLRRRAQVAWPEVAAGARAYCHERELDVIIVDTLDKWSGLRGDDENKSGPMLQALEPLMLAAGEGLAVILVSHQRKASGDHGEAVRGSNALAGAVDVILELERVADVAHARALYGTSRFASTPEELAIELTEDGYADRGDVGALKGRLEADKIMAVLSGEPVTAVEIMQATEIPEATVRRRLEELHDAGRVERTGDGRKGRPYRWRIHSATGNPLVAESNEKPPAGEVEAQLELEELSPEGADDEVAEYVSPAQRDSDVLELLGQAAMLGCELSLLPAELGPIDPSVWMEHNGYAELERSFYCRGALKDGRACPYRRRAGELYCGRHARKNGVAQ